MMMRAATSAYYHCRQPLPKRHRRCRGPAYRWAGARKGHMPEVHRVSVEIGGTEISFETGWMAKQASGAVVVRSGDTRVLSTATAGNLRDVDFLPLTVDVEERMYAAGKIPGSFFKREGRAGEKATLIARMIDRPLRPLFPKGWRRETQLVGMPLSVDQVNPYDVLAMNGASAALAVSDIPFPAPVGAVRIGKVEGNFVINPTEEQLLESDLDLVVSGTDEAILMVEAGANEIPEAEILDEQVLAHYSGDPEAETWGEYRQRAQIAFDALEKKIIRERIAVQKKRPDGRQPDEIRPIDIQVKPLPRTHGSALFTRGQTQALSVVALGTTREEMRIDSLGLETSKRYFHHYNFPPFSVGEAGFMRGPKRRDIGHSALAERALVPVVPSVDEFPYTIRVVSDILESNGSSSMASVCGSSLSLMDAGVPIKRAVAGIAMGLIKEGDDYIVLSDIAGVEDHLGDMDFKVAGTENGISTIQIDPDKIGLLIGKGGETIRGLSEEFEAQIDVNDEGQVLVYAQTGTQGDALVDRIRSMTKEVEVGDEFAGKVVKTTTFGAFVELAKGTDGLLHISNVSPGQRVDTVEDVLNKGDEIAVKVVEVDRERGRIGLRLSTDPEIEGKSVEELATVGTGDKGGRGDRGNGRGRDRERRPRDRDRR